MDTTERINGLLNEATVAATTAVERASDLRGTAARDAAVAALHAGGDQLRAAHTMKLAGGTTGTAMAVLAVAFGVLVLDAATLGYIGVKGSPGQRVAAGIALAGNVAVFGLGRYLRQRTRAAARAGLEPNR